MVKWELIQLAGNTLGVVIASAGTAPLRQALGHLLKVPGCYAALLGLLVWTFSLAVPLPLLRGVELCGRAAVPLFLLLLGMQLAHLESDMAYRQVTLALSVRMVASPLIAFALAWGMGMRPMPRVISVLVWGFPTGAQTAVLALQYGSQPRYVTSVISITTVLSLLTVPVLLSWLL